MIWLACMYLLKAFKNKYWYEDEIVCSEHNEPSIFCSYFFKTACLWVFERTRQGESDAISLCRQVFDWLISCYENGFLPHYFIPQQNLIGHILGEKGRLESLKLWLEKLKSNIWINVTPSIQIDATVKSIMETTAKQLNLSSDSTYEEIIYASYEDDKAEEILGNAARSFKQSSLTKHRLNSVRMYNAHYPPINSFLNMLLIRFAKRIYPSLPEINENGLENPQLLQFIKIIDESPLSVIAESLLTSYLPRLTKLLEIPETLLKSVLAKKTEVKSYLYKYDPYAYRKCI